MAELSTLARPYAKAAFQFADQHNALSEWADMIEFAALAVMDKDFSAFLENPSTTSEQQAKALISVGTDKFDASYQNFIHVLAEQDRLPVLPQIFQLYEQLKAEKEQSLDVLVKSAYPLSDDQQRKLADGLKKKLNCEINITSETDESLIGGVVIRAGDLVLDSSVKGKLAKLAEKLNS